MNSPRILKELKVIHICLFLGLGLLCFEIVGASRPGCSNPVGLEGTAEDSQFSSYTHMVGWDAFMARLFNDYAWCSATNDIKLEFLQIDLVNVQHISCIATQGVRSLYPLFSSYVTTFIIAYSYDGTTWFLYKGSGGSVQTFDGNNDTSSVRYNYFRDTFDTRYLRIYPKTFYHRMCLRVELYGSNDQSAHAPTTQLTTPTTSAPTKATPAVAINTHLSHSLTGHVTKSSTKAKATETPDVTLSNTTPRSTKVAGNTSVDPTIERKDDPIDDRVMTGTGVYIVVSVILGVIAILLIIVLCWHCKYRNRRQQRNGNVELYQERVENVSETTTSTTGL